MKSILSILLLLFFLRPASAQSSDSEWLKKYPDRQLALSAYKQMQKQMTELQKKIGAEQAYYETRQKNRLDYLTRDHYSDLNVLLGDGAESLEHAMRYAQKPWDEYMLKQQLLKDVAGVLAFFEGARAQRREDEVATTLSIGNLNRLQAAFSEAEQALLPLTQKPSSRQNAAQTVDYLTKVAAEYERLKKEKK